MQPYKIINAQGETINKVNASLGFLHTHYPDHSFEKIVSVDESSDPLPRLIIKINSIKNVTDPLTPVDLPLLSPGNMISFKAGEVIEVDIQINDEGGEILPIDRVFSMPLAGQLGSTPRILDVEFIGGVATLTIGGWSSGRWRVTEKEINMDLSADEPKFSFAGLVIKVSE